MKLCNICLVEKDIDDFYKHPHTRDKRQSSCKKCSVKYHTNRNRTTKYNWRKYQYKYTYGITVDEYQTMVEQQGGVCLICCQPEKNKNLSVDHCHKTKKVRGLLCGKCNVGLGYFNDSEEILEAAIIYLKNSAG